MIQQIGAVVGVLTLLLATLWWLRRHGFAVGGLGRQAVRRRLECVERLSLGPQQTLQLVRLGERALLLASSPAGCSLVTSLEYREVSSGEADR